MSASEGWRAFFDGHAPFYMRYVFTRNTMAEVEFLLRELRLEPDAAVLDLGRGTGRRGSGPCLRRRAPPSSTWAAAQPGLGGYLRTSMRSF